jgi:hypothetical protein
MTTKHHISYWVRPNKYAAKCCACGAGVEADAGWTQKDRDSGKWVTYCGECAHANAKALPDGYSAASMAGHRGSHPLYNCCGCGRRVGLVKSNAGKWYFAEVRNGSYGEYRTKVMPWMPHDCDRHR